MLDLNDLIWVRLDEPDDFLKVRETLTRIGIASKNDKTLTQSCHILHKKGQYAIVHFKQLFLLDGKRSDFTEDDRARLNTIANLLHEWGLITLLDVNKSADPVAPLSQIKVISHKEKREWKLVSKYSIGGRKKYYGEDDY
jgi:hypothetical protein